MATLSALLRLLKPGPSSKNALKRIQYRNTSEKHNNSCRKQPYKEKCLIPDDSCDPQVLQTKRLQEATYCMPDCRDGKPNVIPRGCLPWEKPVELCPTKEKIMKVQSLTCEHLCDAYPGNEFFDKLKVSECELRRFQDCLAKTRDPYKCLGLGPKTCTTRKEYPMMHAVQKKYLPGSPTKSRQSTVPEKELDCD